jgi:hypothetical protein
MMLDESWRATANKGGNSWADEVDARIGAQNIVAQPPVGGPVGLGSLPIYPIAHA